MIGLVLSETSHIQQMYSFLTNFDSVCIVTPDEIREDLDLLVIFSDKNITTSSNMYKGRAVPYLSNGEDSLLHHFYRDSLESYWQMGTPLLGIDSGHNIVASKFGYKVEQIFSKNQKHLVEVNSIFSPTYHTILERDFPLFATNPNDTSLDKVAKDQYGNMFAFIHKTSKYAGVYWNPFTNSGTDILLSSIIKYFLQNPPDDGGITFNITVPKRT